MTSIVDRAREFATKAHEGQVRKYTGLPYVTHCESVVGILRGAGIDDEATLAAAWLHDTIEDCPVTFFDIEREFGLDIAELVSFLTDCKPSLGNRKTRKELDRSRLARAPAKAQTIKVADMLDNTESIVARDPAFAVTYMREKAALLPLLTKADAGLLKRAQERIAEYEAENIQNWMKDRPHA